VTLIELGSMAIWAGIVVAGGWVGAHWWGVPGGVGGAVVGIATPLLVEWLGTAILRGRPAKPPCRNGRCDQAQYRVVSTNGEIVYECQCMDRYALVNMPGGRTAFVSVDADGVRSAYMSHGLWGPWVDDRAHDDR
jgi:hypothetical protein